VSHVTVISRAQGIHFSGTSSSRNRSHAAQYDKRWWTSQSQERRCGRCSGAADDSPVLVPAPHSPASGAVVSDPSTEYSSCGKAAELRVPKSAERMAPSATFLTRLLPSDVACLKRNLVFNSCKQQRLADKKIHSSRTIL
jgi:hypothetical protein